MEKPTTAEKTEAKGKPGLKFSMDPKTAAKALPATNESDRTFLAVRLPTPLMRQVKSVAAERGRKVQDVAEEAFTEWLANHR